MAPVGRYAMAQIDQAVDGTENASNGAAGNGPPSELPEVVPDFVGEIHSIISDFLAGGVTEVGNAVSDVASNVLVIDAPSTFLEVAVSIPV